MKKRERAFTTITSLVIAFLFLTVYVFSVQRNWEIPETAKWAVTFMLYYLYFICFRTIALLGLSFYEYLNYKFMPDIEYPPLVTVIMPCFNEGKVIKESIESVLKIDYPNLEILVVDDGSLDDTFERAIEMKENFRLRVVTKANGGKADALNFGISQALGDYVLCIDADSRLEKNVLKNSLPFFINDEQLAAVAGSVEVGNAKTLITKFQKLEYIIGLNFHKKAQSALNMVSIVPGPVGLFKKSVVQEVGGYDSDTFAEDCDLTIKILMAGYNIKYSPDMKAVTEAPDTFYELSIQRYRWSRGTIQAIIKNLGALYSSRKINIRNFVILSYMVIETMIIPSINFVFAMLTLTFALSYEGANLYGPFFLGLIAMDATIALYSILFERQMPSLFFLSVISRVTFGFSLEIMRFYSMIDEVLKVPMKWGTLTRKGLN